MFFIKRKVIIDEILNDLNSLRKKDPPDTLYAIEENIKFFEAIKTFRGYIKWFFEDRPKIDGSRLLELSDFHLANGKWERILQSELLEIEKWKFPDDLYFLRSTILHAIKKSLGKRDILTVVNLGSGAMECERQIIQRLQKQKSDQRILFIGIDSSIESVNTAVENLKNLYLKTTIVTANELDLPIDTHSLLGQDQYGVLIIVGDAFTVQQYFGEKKADILFYTKFRHHLPERIKQDFDTLVLNSADQIIENDNLNNLFLFIVPFILRSRWNHPVLLNGMIFSVLRDPTKTELLKSLNNKWYIKFYASGYIKYLDQTNI